MNQQPLSLNSTAMPAVEEPSMSLDDVLSREPERAVRPAEPPAPVWPLPAVRVGTLTGIAADGGPLVDFEGNRFGRPLPARSTGSLDSASVGSAVALLFEDGDLARPIILGMIQGAGAAAKSVEPAGPVEPAESSALKVETTADGQRVILTAEREIELRCGKASITLTRAGKVIIRGAYLLSRSSGVNRIKGGSVQIN